MNCGALFFAVLALFVAMMNWSFVVANLRFKRQGIDRHVSTIPLLAPIFIVIAAATQYNAPEPKIPGAVLALIALLDISVWSLLLFLVRELVAKYRAKN